MAELITSLQACKQNFAKQDYDRFTVSSVDNAGVNNFVLANMCLYKVNDIAFMLSTGHV